jgi:hypothetical protein
MKKFLLILVLAIAAIIAIEYSKEGYKVTIQKGITPEQLDAVIEDAKNNSIEITITKSRFKEDLTLDYIEGNVYLTKNVSGEFVTDATFSSVSIERGRGRYLPDLVIKITNE